MESEESLEDELHFLPAGETKSLDNIENTLFILPFL